MIYIASSTDLNTLIEVLKVRLQKEGWSEEETDQLLHFCSVSELSILFSCLVRYSKQESTTELGKILVELNEYLNGNEEYYFPAGINSLKSKLLEITNKVVASTIEKLSNVGASVDKYGFITIEAESKSSKEILSLFELKNSLEELAKKNVTSALIKAVKEDPYLLAKQNEEGMAPVHYFAQAGNISLMEIAPYDLLFLPNKQGDTAWHLLAKTADKRDVVELLEEGNYPDNLYAHLLVLNNAGDTPLHCMARRSIDLEELVGTDLEWLLYCKNKSNETVLDLYR